MKVTEWRVGLEADTFGGERDGLVKLTIKKVVFEGKVAEGARIIWVGADGLFEDFLIFLNVASCGIEMIVDVETLTLADAVAQVEGFFGLPQSPIKRPAYCI